MPARKPADSSKFPGRVGLHLRHLREERKLTVATVADKCGVSIGAVYFWEAGKRDVPLWAFPILKRLYKLKSHSELIPD